MVSTQSGHYGRGSCVQINEIIMWIISILALLLIDLLTTSAQNECVYPAGDPNGDLICTSALGGNIILPPGMIPAGGVCTLSCAAGYAATVTSVTCDPMVSPTMALDSCTAVPQQGCLLPIVENSASVDCTLQADGLVAPGGNCMITCATGYSTTTDTVTCDGATGLMEQPVCSVEGLSCDIPVVAHSSQVLCFLEGNRVIPNHRCMIYCLDGFTASHTEVYCDGITGTITQPSCLPNGVVNPTSTVPPTLDPNAIVCSMPQLKRVEVSCTGGANPLAVPPGERCSITCAYGFYINIRASSLLTCMENGEFDYIIPTPMCIDRCKSGKYWKNTSCKNCPQNTYRVKNKGIKCKSCPEGKSTMGTGAKKVGDCLSGPIKKTNKNTKKNKKIKRKNMLYSGSWSRSSEEYYG